MKGVLLLIFGTLFATIAAFAGRDNFDLGNKLLFTISVVVLVLFYMVGASILLSWSIWAELFVGLVLALLLLALLMRVVK